MGLQVRPEDLLAIPMEAELGDGHHRCLANGGALEHAQEMAAHERPGTPRSMIVRKNALRRDEIHDPNNSDYRGERPSCMVDDRLSPGAGAFPFVRG